MNEVDKAKYWLLGDSADAILWRHDGKNQKDVGDMVETLASSPGGLSRDWIASRLADERRKITYAQNTTAKRERRLGELKAAKWLDARHMGVSAQDFERQWPSMLAKMISDGSLSSEFDKVIADKRSRAAKTF